MPKRKGTDSILRNTAMTFSIKYNSQRRGNKRHPKWATCRGFWWKRPK